jgi:diguanylate cyclase (GGDEF)-like protein/PAS domain S-box-containing protein
MAPTEARKVLAPDPWDEVDREVADRPAEGEWLGADEPERFGEEIREHLARAKLASLFLDSPAFMAVLRGPEHEFVNVNPAFYRLVGKRRLLGRTVRDAFPDLQGSEYFEILDRVYREGETYVGAERTLKLVRGPGAEPELVHVSFVYHPLQEEDGSTWGILAHGIDLTERWRARRTLRRRARQQAAVAELGRSALEGADPGALVREACRAVAAELDADRSAFLELGAEEAQLVLRDGHGWRAGAAGATVPADRDTAPGRTLRGRHPVAVSAGEDGGIPLPGRMEEHALARSALFAAVRGAGEEPLGVLAAYDAGARKWDQEETDFLEAMAHLLGASLAWRESERQLSTLAENLPGVLYRCRNDPEWTMEYLSAGFRELTGWDPEEILAEGGLEYADLIHPGDRERVWETVQAAVEEDRPFQLLYRLDTRGGGERWVWEQGRVVEPTAGAGLRLEGCILDMTESKRAREEAERSRRLIETTFRSVEDAVFLIRTEDRTIEACNPAAARMFGREQSELEGASTEILHVDREHYERFGRESEQALEREGVYRGESRMQRADGTAFYTEHVVSFVDAEGEPDRAVSVVRDVTERKVAERERRRAEKRYRKLFQASPAAVSVSELESGRLLDVNEAFTELFGWDRAEAVGSTVEELGIWPSPEVRERSVRRLRETGELRGLELQFRDRAGNAVEALCSAELLEIDDREYVLGVAHDITERKVAERELQRLALRDTLTGLPNRTLFLDRLDHALERHVEDAGRVGVLYLDLDRFKVVNDTLGHSAGDSLLGMVASRIEDRFPDEATVARLGGDEFGVLLEDLDESEEVAPHARRLEDAFREPFEVRGTTFHCDASIGIATGGADDRAEDLLRFADVAMFRAKESEGTAHHVFDAAVDEAETRRLHRENELRDAIEDDQLRLEYQPVVRLSDRRIVGVEALVRWEHPERGLVHPDEFIPLAEETGLIVPLGHRVLEEACRWGARWHGMTAEEEPLVLSVNLSPRQYQEPDVAERIAAAADTAGLPPEALQLEITESVLLSGHGKLQQLQRRGMRVAIDDFGTGYSSLQYLRRLQADVIKVDRTFVAELETDPRDSVMVQAILLVAQQIGIDVVAEGIETAAQLEHLEELGCRWGQGYHLGRPVRPEEFESLLEVD